MPTFLTLTVKDGTGTNTIGTWTGNASSVTVQQVIDYICNTYHVYINHIYSPARREVLDNSKMVSEYFSDGGENVWDATTAVYVGENVISELYLGEININEVYIGTTLIR